MNTQGNMQWPYTVVTFLAALTYYKARSNKVWQIYLSHGFIMDKVCDCTAVIDLQ